jgi:hypothetical protein
MKEEDIFPTPPEAPDPTLWQRLTNSPYFWWFTAMFFLAVLLMWLPSQCSFDALQFPQEKKVDLDQEPTVNIEQELVQQADGLWYLKSSGEAYSGVGSTYHENGHRKSRRKFADGGTIGLIEEWDSNGSLLGPRFKGEFIP